MTGAASVPARPSGTLAEKLERLLLPLVVVVGALGIAFPSLPRSIDAAGAVDPTLAVLVFTAGLAVDARSIGAARRRWFPLAVAVVASSVVLPVLAWAFAHLVSGPPHGGVLAVGVAPSEVASLGLVAIATGDVSVSVALLVASSVVTVMASGPVLELLAGGAGVRVGGLLVTLGLVVALPLASGAAFRRAVVNRADVLVAGRVLGVVALLVLLWEVTGEVELRSSYLGVVLALGGFFAGSWALGWLLARSMPKAQRLAVLLPVAMRDFAVAAGIAASAFGPRAAGPLGVYGLLVVVGGAAATRAAGRPSRGPRPSQL